MAIDLDMKLTRQNFKINIKSEYGIDANEIEEIKDKIEKLIENETGVKIEILSVY